MCVSRRVVVGDGEVDSCGLHLVELLVISRDGIRKVDDVEDLRSSEVRVIWTARTAVS
jgi:hypothetical protein